MNPAEVLAAAREILPLLEDLAPDAAPGIETRLRELLAAADRGEDVTEVIIELLAGHDATRRWLRKRLAAAGERERSAESAPPPAMSAPPTTVEPPPAAPPPPPAADPPRSAYGLLACPDAIAVGHEVELVVGLAAEQQPGVAGGRFERPLSSVGDYDVAITVDAPGFALPAGESWRQVLHVTAAAPYPTTTLHLTPTEALGATKVEATYAIDGQTVGLAVRYVRVVEDAAAAAPASVAAGVTLAVPSAASAPDITIAIRRWSSPSGGRLRWTVESPHEIPIPEPAESDVGEDPATFAKGLITAMTLREGKPGMLELLLGRGRQIARDIPRPVRDAIRAAAARATGGPPTLLLLSEEPNVPWELAVFDEPLLRDDLPAGTPPFLACQVVVGRWLLADEPPPPPVPPAELEVAQMAVVTGVYDSNPSWDRLEEAEREAAELRRRWGAAGVDATTRAVLDCLRGQPHGDVLHFAMHGKYDPEGLEHGLALVDGQMLDPAQVEAHPLAGRPFVFLNACQVGAAEAVLGDYAGMAASFLHAGASAVVAPIWSIDDELAHRIALEFYEEVLVADGRPAEALARRRQAVGAGDGTSGTLLAYQFFGHPRMRLAAAGLGTGDPPGGGT